MEGKISLKQVADMQKHIYNKAIELVAKKGHDYNRKQQISGDTLFNLRVSSIVGITPSPAHGVVVRLCDKLMRLVSLVDAPPANKEETLEDTIADIWNYTTYLLLFKREERWLKGDNDD